MSSDAGSGEPGNTLIIIAFYYGLLTVSMAEIAREQVGPDTDIPYLLWLSAFFGTFVGIYAVVYLWYQRRRGLYAAVVVAIWHILLGLYLGLASPVSGLFPGIYHVGGGCLGLAILYKIRIEFEP